MSFSRRALTLVLSLCVAVGPAAAASATDPYHPEQRAAAADPYHPEQRAEGAARVVAAPAAAERTREYWVDAAQAALEARVRAGDAGAGGPARAVVMFLGDGMSVPTLAAARTMLGQRNNLPGEEQQLAFEKFPTAGLTKTYCVDAQIADSACTSTAYLCGVKANRGTIGVSAAVPRWNCEASVPESTHAASIAAWALDDGRDAGIITTTRITHASPAGAYARAANRHWENDAEVLANPADINLCPDIAHQLIHAYPGKDFKVILGGGRREFITTNTTDEEGNTGRRTDNRNLIEEWQTDKQSRNATYQYVWNRDQLLDANATLPEYLLGLFEPSHMEYHMLANATTEPTLEELTEVAIRMLSRNEKGFFLFVEGGRIDHGHHDNQVELALDETLEMSKAVARAAELLPAEDSLIVVTADHAHVMAFNGYTQRGGDVLGPSDDRDRDGVRYMTLSYTNGPGFRPLVDGRRVDVTLDSDYRSPEWMTHVDVPLASETHGGDDVAVFARGPHHALFGGLYEQNHIPHLMAYAACIGPGLHACSAAAPAHLFPLALAPLLLVISRLCNLSL